MCGGYPEYFFFFNDTATTEIYTFPYTTLFRSHEIEAAGKPLAGGRRGHLAAGPHRPGLHVDRFTPAAQEVGQLLRSEEHTSELQSRLHLVCRLLLEKKRRRARRRRRRVLLRAR